MCVKRNTYSNIGCTIKAKLFAHDAASTQVTLGPNGPRAPCSRSASVQIFGFYTAPILLYVTPRKHGTSTTIEIKREDGRSHLRLRKVVEKAGDLESALAEEAVPFVAVVPHAHKVPGLVEVLL